MSLISRINDLAARIAAEIKLKQDKLVSGTSIKTINNASILGPGNITIEGGSGGSTTPVVVAADGSNTHTIDVPTGSYFKINAAVVHKTIQHAGSVTASFGNATSGTLNLPGNLQEGDVVFIFIGCDGRTPALPSGWTNVDSTTSGTEYSRTAYKVMGSTPDTSVGLTLLQTSTVGISMAFRNVHPDIFDATKTVRTGTLNMPIPWGITTVTNNAWVIIVGYLDDDNVEASVSAPSGYSNLAVKQSTTVGQTVMVSSKVRVTAGSESPGRYIGTGDDEWVALIFALKPAVDGPQIAVSNVPTDVVTEIQLRVTSDSDLISWFPGITWNWKPDFKIYDDVLITLTTEDGANWNAMVYMPFKEFTSKAVVTGTQLDWASASVFTKTITGATTFTFTNLVINKVITLVLTGNYAITLPANCRKIAGTYNGLIDNYIQFHCTNAESEEVWYVINQQEV